MGSFKVLIESVAESDIRAVPFPFRRQLNQRLMRLKEEPRPADAEQVSEADKFRLRVHGWVVLYEVEDSRELVTVWAVRKD